MTIAQLSLQAFRKIIRYAGRLMTRPGGRFVSLDEGSLLAAARRRAPDGEFDDMRFLEPLRQLLRSLERDARLNFLGRVAARADIIRLLTNRLLLAHDRRTHPEIAAGEIRQPLFITGLPRSGTTFLHGLLAQDPAHRVPLTWETMYPSPPNGAIRADEEHIQKAARQLAWLHRLAPDFQKIHPVGATLPEECLIIMSHSFLSVQFSSMFFVPSYQTWLDQQELCPAYEIHRQFLQQLQYRHSGTRWVLKAPAHLAGLPALFAVYPDARVILTHRNPIEVVGSLASLHATLRGVFSDTVDAPRIGPEVSAALAGEIERAMRARAANVAPPERFLDVWYTDLMRDPIGAVRQIYAQFEFPLSSAAEARMRRYVVETPKDRHGRHEYTLERFGLSAETEHERYRTYCEHFGLNDAAGGKTVHMAGSS